MFTKHFQCEMSLSVRYKNVLRVIQNLIRVEFMEQNVPPKASLEEILEQSSH